MSMAKTLIGFGGLAVGLVAGYHIPRGGGEVLVPTTSEVRPATGTRGTKSVAERASIQRDIAAKKFVRSIPRADDFSGREKWLATLSLDDLPKLIDSLCANIGPDGLDYSDKDLLTKGFKKWMAEDREGVVAWIANLPAGPTKRYFMKSLLGEMLKDDPARALTLSEAFQVEDPEWKHTAIRDQRFDLLISEAWKKPNATADEMLNLYLQLDRGGGCGGSSLGKYPEGFDFQKFLDGVVSQYEKDKKYPSSMPSDVLEGWARVNPGAAAQWFFASAENQQGVPFQEWADIAKAVSQTSGPDAYFEWTADIISSVSSKQIESIVRGLSEPDVIGVTSRMTDIGLRDQVFTIAAAKHLYARNDQTVEFLAKISTPEARLNAIKQNSYSYARWVNEYPPDQTAWQKLGLSREQVDAVLPKQKN